MRKNVCAFACLLVALAAGGAAWAFSGTAAGDTATLVVQSSEAEVVGCCVTGDCCCPGQGTCCDLTKRATAEATKSLKKAGCCSTGNCCCPGAGSCCATSEAVPAKECCPK